MLPTLGVNLFLLFRKGKNCAKKVPAKFYLKIAQQEICLTESGSGETSMWVQVEWSFEASGDEKSILLSLQYLFIHN